MATQRVENTTARNVTIARAAYEAYVTKNRPALDRLIGEDFHFTSPLDNRLDRETYFRRCWPNSKLIEGFDFIHLVTDAERVFVTYEGRNTNGRRFRNTEREARIDSDVISFSASSSSVTRYGAGHGTAVLRSPPRHAGSILGPASYDRACRAGSRTKDSVSGSRNPSPSGCRRHALHGFQRRVVDYGAT